MAASVFSGDETAPLFGFLDAAAALVSCMGAAYGTAKSGVGVALMGVTRPGVLGIYGLMFAVVISARINPKAARRDASLRRADRAAAGRTPPARGDHPGRSAADAPARKPRRGRASTPRTPRQPRMQLPKPRC